MLLSHTDNENSANTLKWIALLRFMSARLQVHDCQSTFLKYETSSFRLNDSAEADVVGV